MAAAAAFETVYAEARRGDRDATDHLWRRFEPRLRAYVRRIVMGNLNAPWLEDEVVQHVSLDLLAQLPSLPAGLVETRLLRVLFKFGKRRAHDVMRARFTRAAQTEALLDDIAMRMSSIGPVTKRDAQERIRQLITTLAQPYSRILILRNIEGLSFEAAAQQMGVRETTARKQHSRAVAMLLEKTRGYRA